MSVHTKLHVTVHYIAAEEPFKDEDAESNETVGHLKGRVLNAFGLTEGSTPEGNTVNYTLYQHKTPLEDMNETLGALSGQQKVLQLKLVQQITQGR